MLGLPSSGLHSNGFSLVRKVVARAGLSYADPCPWAPDTPLGRAAQPAEMAPIFVFLASDAASYVTASVYAATGGQPTA